MVARIHPGRLWAGHGLRDAEGAYALESSTLDDMSDDVGKMMEHANHLLGRSSGTCVDAESSERWGASEADRAPRKLSEA